MRKEEAIEIAERFAKQSDWLWKEPIVAVKKRKYFFGKSYWNIISNSDKIGINVRILIDDATGEILNSSFYKR